jgi:hypothetical protein
MVERLVRNEEVWGSIPHGSTRDFKGLGAPGPQVAFARYHGGTTREVRGD